MAMDYYELMRMGGGRPVNYPQEQPNKFMGMRDNMEQFLAQKAKEYLKSQQQTYDPRYDMVNPYQLEELARKLYRLRNNNYSPSIYGPANLTGIQD